MGSHSEHMIMLTVGYLPHGKLQRPKLSKWFVKKVDHVDNLKEADIVFCL